MAYQVFLAQSLHQAWQLQAQYPKGVYIAGGTDMLPRLNQGIEQHEAIICLDNITGLNAITATDTELRIGALCRLAHLAVDERLAAYAGLQYAAGRVASPQIRNTATIGGNLLQENRCVYFNQSVSWRRVEHCFKLGGDRCYQYKSSPKCVALLQSDLAPVLIAHQASIVLCGPQGRRQLPLEQLYLEAGAKAKQPEEILTEIIIPIPGSKWYSAYQRETIRGSFDFPLISCAAVLEENNGAIKRLGLCIGSAGIMPRQVDTAALQNRPVTAIEQDMTEIIGNARKLIAPFTDTRISHLSRRALGEAVIEKTLQQIIKGVQ